MPRKIKFEYPDLKHTTYREDITVLEECFSGLKSHDFKIGINDGLEEHMNKYKISLFVIEEIVKKYPDNGKVALTLQNNLYLVGDAIYSTKNMDAVKIASEFMENMGKILTSGKISPENQFRIAYGLGCAVDSSRYNIHTKLNGVFSDKEDTLLGIIIKERNFPCIAALSGMLQRRLAKPDVVQFNLSWPVIDGVYSAIYYNYDVDEHSRKTAMDMAEAARAALRTAVINNITKTKTNDS